MLAMVAAFALMVTLVPTVAREQTVIHDASAAGGSVSTVAPGTGALVPGVPGGGPVTTGPGSGGTSTTRAVAPGHTSSCTDPRHQVPGDPYSPPCLLFSGDNRSPTTRGV